jgi:hypothetical protein
MWGTDGIGPGGRSGLASFVTMAAIATMMAIGATCCRGLPSIEPDASGGAGGGSDGATDAGNDSASGAGSGLTGVGDVAGGGGGAGGSADAGGSDGADGVDAAAGVGGAQCPTTGAFGPIRRLPLNDRINSPWAARLAPDQLSIYLTDSSDILVARRASRDADFYADFMSLGLVDRSETNVDGWAPSISGDGLMILFEKWTDAVPRLKILAATRSDLSDPFTSPALVSNVNSSDDQVEDGSPYLLPNGLVLYFTSNRSGNSDIFRASRVSASEPFGDPVAVASVNSLWDEDLPAVTPDELTIYFGSRREVPGASGDYDIYMATRTNVVQDFGPAVNVRELNTSMPDLPNWISADNCLLYLQRDGVYTATRGP